MNNSITGGTVAIEDGIKAKEDFAPARKVKVELSFSVPEGGDGVAFLDGVSAVAEGKLRELLGKAPAAPKPVQAATQAPVEAPAKAPAKPKAAKEKAPAAPPAPEKTKADLAKEAGLPTKDIVTKGPSDEELLEDEPTITAAGKAVAEEDDLNDILGEAAPPPVTDLELGKAAQEKNAKMKAEHGEAWAPAKIRELISKYSDGKRINDIPAAKRPQFLKELDALK